MARARLLKPGFFANEKLTELHPFGRLLFAGLWTLADREGRLPDRPKWIKGALFPYENVPVERLLGELAELGFIERYQDERERYIQIVSFLKHQTPHVREPASTIPAPDEHEASPVKGKSSPADPVTVLDPVTETVAVTAASVPEPTDRDPLPFEPVEKPKRERQTEVTAETLLELQDRFPTVNVPRAWEKAQDWMLANGRRKKDHVAFLRNWVRDEEDRERNRIQGPRIIASNGHRPTATERARARL